MLTKQRPMLCKQCGEKLKQNAKFCGNCGAEVIVEEDEANEEQTSVFINDRSLNLESSNDENKITLLETLTFIADHGVIDDIFLAIIFGTIFGFVTGIVFLVFVIANSECLKEEFPNKKTIFDIVTIIAAIIVGANVFETYSLSIYIDVIKQIWMQILFVEIFVGVLKWVNEKFFNKKILSVFVSVITGIIFISIISNGFTAVEKFTPVKDGYLTAYCEEITIGEAFDNYFEKPSWEYFVSENNENVVEFNGKAYVNDIKANIKIQFVISENNETFEIYTMAVNEVPQTMIYLYAMLAAIYE